MDFHKYMRRKAEGEGGIYKNDMLPIIEDGGIPVYISKDGKVHARGFVDINDNFEFYSENDEFKVAAKDEKLNYFKEYIFSKSDNKIFKSESYEVLAGAFQNIYYPLVPYDNEEPPVNHKRYNLLSKKTKKSIKSLTQSINDPVSFHFHFFEGSNRHSEPRIQTSWFGPFNFDVWVDPELMVKDINDLIIIKSGRYNSAPKTPTLHDVEAVFFSTGTLGHVYVETPSIPDHNYSSSPNMESSTRRFKFKNKDNTNRTQELGVNVSIGTDVVAVFRNGVFGRSPRNAVSYQASGLWNVDSVYGSTLDGCNGEIEQDFNLENYNGYNYKAAPACVCDLFDTQNHSPLIGYSKDGFPIYGPHGYSQSFNPTSQIKRMETSYRLTQTTSRTSGPSFNDEPSGTYIEDYEYVNGLGDLDEHNGRLCVTPEYPNGIYAYFTTIDSNFNPAYPYIIGPTFYGVASGGQGYEGAVTETPIYHRNLYSNRNDMLTMYTDPELNTWEVYGDTNRLRRGIQSEKIVYVSPHIVMQDSGVFLYTGTEQSYKYVSGVQQNATYQGNLRIATGNGDFLVRKESFSYPTSVNCRLLENNPLSGGMNFLYEDPDTNMSIHSVSPPTVTGTHFYSQYKNHKRVKNKVYSGQWNGVIPAGTPFKVENWAFNGEMMGFDGKLTVRPITPHPLTSGKMITIHAAVTGQGSDYDDAYSNAMELSRDQINQQTNILLVNSGVKDKNYRMKSLEKLKDISS